MGARPLSDRFNSNVCRDDGTGCWNWTAYKDKNGYGRIGVNYTSRPAHRVSYEMYCGEIPDGMMVLHSCDNASCVNPGHLSLGTHSENMADMVKKGRQVRGAAHKRPCAKLTETDVIAIRAATGVLQRELAAQYGVGQDEISRIRSGKRWNHL